VEGGRRERDGAVFSPPRSIHRPFLLRRIKTDVETSLPSKKEILLYAQMTPLQKKLDKQLRDKTLQVKKKREREWREGGERAQAASSRAFLSF
jgi:ATP-dependent DNA helicase